MNRVPLARREGALTQFLSSPFWKEKVAQYRCSTHTISPGLLCTRSRKTSKETDAFKNLFAYDFNISLKTTKNNPQTTNKCSFRAALILLIYLLLPKSTTQTQEQKEYYFRAPVHLTKNQQLPRFTYPQTKCQEKHVCNTPEGSINPYYSEHTQTVLSFDFWPMTGYWLAGLELRY